MNNIGQQSYYKKITVLFLPRKKNVDRKNSNRFFSKLFGIVTDWALTSRDDQKY